MSFMSTHTDASASACRISIIIKALNEEKRIARAIETALLAIARMPGEVILADSCSTDRTLEIARAFPIKIVQLANPAERCCGIGPQLGYQHSTGQYVYILDGDMEMREDFIDQAVAYLDQHPTVGGVGGYVVEHNVDSLEYKARVERQSHHMQAGPVDRLDMGGLYRRTALEQVGYFSDRNLHSYEELDLAVRLRAKGWILQRIDVAAVDHHGHDVPPYQLLKKRWSSRYINGVGEVLRAAVGQAHFGLLARSLKEAWLYCATLAWLMLLAVLPLLPFVSLREWLIVAMGSVLLILAVMAGRKRSLSKASYSLVSWIVNAAGMLRGMIGSRVDPRTPIASKDVSASSTGQSREAYGHD